MVIRGLNRGLWTVALAIGLASAARAGGYEDRLAAAGVEPTAKAIRTYLGLLAPSPERARRIERLLAELGDEDYWVRVEAAKELRAEPVVPVGRLRDLCSSDDAEVRWQARRILDDPRIGEHSRTVFAALAVVREQKLAGLVDVLLDAIPRFGDAELRREAARAIGATAGADDRPLLRDALESARPDVRAAAIHGLAAAGGKDAIGTLRARLDDPSETVRYTAAVAVLNLGEREALRSLVALLDAEDASVRARAISALRTASERTFGYSSYGGASDRAAAREKWEEWVREKGATAELTLPVGRGRPVVGRIIVCAYSANKVLEIDFDGKVLWSQPLASAFPCQGLPDGSRLVGSYSTRRIVEYDARGRETWSTALDGRSMPTGLERLPNGRTLVASGQSTNRVVELDRSGKVVWSATVEGGVTDAKRLPNGNTICALYNSSAICEIDRGGKVVWRIAAPGRPYGICPLPNGNVLAAEHGSGRVVEYDRKGKEVKVYGDLGQCYAANLLSDGRIVVGSRAGVVVITPDGKRRTFPVATGVVYAYGY